MSLALTVPRTLPVSPAHTAPRDHLELRTLTVPRSHPVSPTHTARRDLLVPTVPRTHPELDHLTVPRTHLVLDHLMVQDLPLVLPGPMAQDLPQDLRLLTVLPAPTAQDLLQALTDLRDLLRRTVETAVKHPLPTMDSTVVNLATPPLDSPMALAVLLTRTAPALSLTTELLLTPATGPLLSSLISSHTEVVPRRVLTVNSKLPADTPTRTTVVPGEEICIAQLATVIIFESMVVQLVH